MEECRKGTLFGFTAQVSCRNWKPHIPESMSDSVPGERGSSSVLIVLKVLSTVGSPFLSLQSEAI